MRFLGTRGGDDVDGGVVGVDLMLARDRPKAGLDSMTSTTPFAPRGDGTLNLNFSVLAVGQVSFGADKITNGALNGALNGECTWCIWDT